MTAWFDLSAFLSTFREHLRRAVLTVLGVAWGTFSVVGLGAFATGLETRMATRAAGMGEGIVILWPGLTTVLHQGLPAGRRLQVEPADVRELRDSVAGIAEVSPEFTRYVTIRRGDSVFRPQVTGVDASYGALRNLAAESGSGGRFLNPIDVAEARRVVFLGDRVARQLFGSADPIGATLSLVGSPFLVVGVLKSKVQDSDYGAHDDARVFVPTSSFQALFGQRFVDDFVVRARTPERLPAVLDGLFSVLGRRLGFASTDRMAFNIWDTTEGDRVRSQAFLGMRLLTLLAGSLTVLVGAIGVANLMFLVVRRRTNEFGLRMALGARPGSILRMVLVEAVVLVGLGGLLGFLAAGGLAGLVGLTPWTDELGYPRISGELAAAVVGLLVVVGVAAGWVPARRAAGLSPGVALAEI